jgi:hypothetical protein
MSAAGGSGGASSAPGLATGGSSLPGASTGNGGGFGGSPSPPDASAPATGSGGASSGAGGDSTGGGGSAAQGGAAGVGEPGTAAYTCTLMIGILATEEWYDAGFETMVDNSRWELIYVHSGFIELWANPQDPVWSTATMSPCAQNATKPDRVIFVALNFDFTTLAEWLPPVTAAVKNLEAKYPSAKRIELMSFIRAPGDAPCPQAPAKRSTITPAQDDAMAMVAAANPGLVVVAPQFEAKTCNEFSSNPPHPSPTGMTAWAKMMADYYR